MAKKKPDYRALRRLAEEVIRRIFAEGDLYGTNLDDLVTSLVRQWVTYDGAGTLIVDGLQAYLDLGRTPLGVPCVNPHPVSSDWLDQFMQDWKISPADLPEIIDQLNRGQSAEVTNMEEVPIRLWVNPKERAKGVEPLVKQTVPPGTTRNFRKIAAVQLEQFFAGKVCENEMDALISSVVEQWGKHDGHASVFIDGTHQLVFKYAELGDGKCETTTGAMRVDVSALLDHLGFAPQTVPEVIARINLSQEVQFRDKKGVPSLLWHDPKARRFRVRPITSNSPSGIASIFCPKCSAVLKPWQIGLKEQRCPICGHLVTIE